MEGVVDCGQGESKGGVDRRETGLVTSAGSEAGEAGMAGMEGSILTSICGAGQSNHETMRAHPDHMYSVHHVPNTRQPETEDGQRVHACSRTQKPKG